MYPAELEIKDTTESTTSASYLDLLLSIGRDGQVHTSIYDKRDDFNFHITNFPFLSSNIPSSPAYGVFISQLIRYSRACSSYECFILRARRLSSKLLKQGYLAKRLKSSFRKFYGRYGDLIQQYEVSLSRMLHDILILDQQWLPNQSDFPPISWPWYRAWPSPILSGFHGAFATGVACQQGTLTLPDTWFRPHFGTCSCSNCWDQTPRTCHVLTRLFTSNTPWYFLDFACDASKEAISAVAYLKLYDGENVYTSFLLGNAKVAPGRGHTISHIELLAAVMAIDLADITLEQLIIDSDSTRYFTDCRIVLGYIPV